MINKIGTFKDYNDGTLKTVFDVGDGHIPELLESACAVDPGGLILPLRHGLQGGEQQQKNERRVLPDVDQQNSAESRFGIQEPVVPWQPQAFQKLVDNTIVGGEHHAPAQRHRNRRQQLRQEQQGTHDLLAPLQAIDENRHQQAQSHFQNDCQYSKLDGVQYRLTEIIVFEKLDVVFEENKGCFVRPFQVVIIGKAVDQCENQRIGSHNDQNDHGGRQHFNAEPFGLTACGL